MSDCQIGRASDALPGKESRKRIPIWGWMLGVLFFPAGLFLTLGSARALRWRIAGPLAACAWLVQVILVRGLALSGTRFTEGSGYLVLGLWFYTLSVAQLQYALGSAAGVWSDRARGIWRILGYVGVGMVLLASLGLGLQILVECCSASQG